MKILKLLSKKYLSIFLILFLCTQSFADEKPVDIWNISEEQKKEQSSSIISVDENKEVNNETEESTIYKMQTQKQSDDIQLDNNLSSQEIKISGLYDPEDYGLDI